MILIAVIWGATFSLIQLGLKDSGPLFLVGLRFLFASLMFGLPSLTALRGLERVDLHADVKIGAVYALICVLQAYGLKHIQSSTSAFIAATYIPMVPLVQWAMTASTLGGAALIFLGLAISGREKMARAT